MSNMTKIIGAAALGLGVAVAIPVLGHGFGGGYGNMHGDGGMHGGMHGGYSPGHMMGNFGMHGDFGGNVEQRLGDLKKSLELTTDQQTAWDQYETEVKSMVESRPWENMGTDAESHFDQMQAHFSQMKAVHDAQKALYDTLTEQQKDTINKYMPGRYGHHHLGYNP